MRFPFDPPELAERAAGVLGPESGLFEDLDAAGFGDALRRALQANLTHPANALSATVRLAADLARIPIVSAAKIVPAGVVRITELQEEGWTYLRP